MKRFLAGAVLICLVPAAPVQAGVSPDARSRRLLPVDGRLWLEATARVGEGGLPARAVALLELWTTLAGRLHRLPEGARVRVHLQAVAGTMPSQIVGGLQVTSNLEARPVLRPYELWYEQRWDRLSVLVGWHDVSNDFETVPAAGLFANSSFGLNPEIALTGVSTYPLTTPGLRLRYHAGAAYAAAGFYDGVPRRAEETVWEQMRPRFQGSTFGIAELGHARHGHHKVAFGVWVHDHDYADARGLLHQGNGGAYAVGEVVRPLGARDARQSFFVQWGQALGDRNRVRRYLGAGARYDWPQEAPAYGIGIAVARASYASWFRRLHPEFGAAETVVELTGYLRLHPMLLLQPGWQFVHRPGLDPAVRHRHVPTLRLVWSF